MYGGILGCVGGVEGGDEAPSVERVVLEAEGVEAGDLVESEAVEGDERAVGEGEVTYGSGQVSHVPHHLDARLYQHQRVHVPLQRQVRDLRYVGARAPQRFVAHTTHVMAPFRQHGSQLLDARPSLPLVRGSRGRQQVLV